MEAQQKKKLRALLEQMYSEPRRLNNNQPARGSVQQEYKELIASAAENKIYDVVSGSITYE